MGFIERELDRIGNALRERRSALPPDGDESELGRDYFELYAAQQALSRAPEPEGIRAPYDAIVDTLLGSASCPANSRPSRSSDIRGLGA
jgi:hypothetical protein